MLSHSRKQTDGNWKRTARTKGWTPERRRAQRVRIRRQQPWRFSTGPRSVQGKEKIRFNALKHGNRRMVWRELRHILAEHRRMLRELDCWMTNRERHLRRARKLLHRHPRPAPQSGAPNGDPAQNLSGNAGRETFMDSSFRWNDGSGGPIPAIHNSGDKMTGKGAGSSIGFET